MSEIKTEADYGMSEEQAHLEMGRGTAQLLRISLSCAVPLCIERARRYTDAEFKQRAELAGAVVAERGDLIQFRGKKPRRTAEAFNALAEGLALLAYRPGGVHFLGMHFEADQPKEARSRGETYAQA